MHMPTPGFLDFIGGILWGGTRGERLARWIVHDDPSRQALSPSSAPEDSADKVQETWGWHMHARVPGEDRPAGRPQKTFPSYDLLTAKGAVWTTFNGYEFPRWFAS